MIIAVVMAIVDCHIGLIVGKWLLSVGMGDDSFRFDSFIRIDRSVVAGVRVWSLFILFFGDFWKFHPETPEKNPKYNFCVFYSP